MGCKSALMCLLLIIILGCNEKKFCTPKIVKEIYAEPTLKGNNNIEYSLYLLLDDFKNCKFDSLELKDAVLNYLENDDFHRIVFNVQVFRTDQNWNYGETLSQDWGKLEDDRVAEIWFDSNGNETTPPN